MASSTFPQYLLLGCHKGEESRDSILSVLKSRVTNLCEEVVKFDVPDNLKFGSFDSLIAMMDDLAKHDATCETVIRRIERQLLDLDTHAEFKILFRQKTMTVESYVRSFVWDDTKWPRSRTLHDNLQTLTSIVQRIDEDVKNKAFLYSDAKQAFANYQKQKGTGSISLGTVDLVDILTPQVVRSGDFVEKEHLTTVLVVVPDQAEKDFLAEYETMSEFVVPRSAKKFEKIEGGKVMPIMDKDNSVLYRVILFKSAVDSFTALCKTKKLTVRQFEYSPEKFAEQQQFNESLQTELQKQELGLKRHCAAAFSDATVSWMHLKAMRVFVEAVLRYGVPPNFASFLVKPVKAKNMTKLRTVLSDVFKASGLFGQSYIGNASAKEEEEGESYYPYVSLNMNLLSTEVKA